MNYDCLHVLLDATSGYFPSEVFFPPNAENDGCAGHDDPIGTLLGRCTENTTNIVHTRIGP